MKPIGAKIVKGLHLGVLADKLVKEEDFYVHLP